MAKLIIESGSAPRDVPLVDRCRIGRDPDNDLALNDGGMSRRHCEIRRDGDGYVLQDLKSANGTYRNEERIENVRLEEGDRIRLGGVTLKYTADDAVTAPPAGASSFLLAFVAGEKKDTRVPVTGNRVSMGRKPGNTVVLKDPKVSGVHAEVVLEDGHPVLRDLGSTNGTFLEGKKVDEVPLSHGDRVLVGDSEFVFLDARMPEPAALGGTPVDAAQTLVDVPQVKKVKAVDRGRSPLAVVGLILLLAGLGGAGFFYWQVQGRTSVAAAPPPAAGNLLGARWSLETAEGGEDPAAAFELQAGTPAAFSVAAAPARSGRQCLSARPDGASAVARLREPIPIASGREAAISGYVRSTGSAYGLLCAVFLKSTDPEYRIPVCVGASSEPEWTAVAGTVVPPTGADQLALELIAAGEDGEVRFDDLAVTEGNIGKPAVTALNGFEFETIGHALLIQRGGEGLLRILGPRFVGSDGSVRDVPRYLASVASRDAGRVLLQGRGGLDFSSALERNGEVPALRIEWSNAPSGALTEVQVPLVLLPPLADEAVGVLRAGVLEPFRDSFEAEGVEGLVLGRGLTRMRVTLEPPVAVRATRTGPSFELLLRAPPSAAKLLARIQVDFVAEKANAQELLAKARTLVQARKLGETLATLDRITNEFPFDENVLKEADERRREILKERERLEARVAAATARAQFLASVTAYAEAQKEAEDAAAAFAGTDAAKAFLDRRNELLGDREQLVRDAGERDAAQLLSRLETALAQDPPQTHVARQIADYLTQKYPWSEAAQAAAGKVGN